jgi:hypothetical protein
MRSSLFISLLLCGCTLDGDVSADPSDALVDAGDYNSDCGAVAFMDVSAVEVPNGQPAPRLDARCEGNYLVVDSNSVPTFEFVQITPNRLSEQNNSWKIPRYPEPASSAEQIPLLGAVAVVINGSPIYGPNEAPQHGTADPFLDDILDYCNGHTGPQGEYHFHAPPECLFEAYDGVPYLVVGYAFDGYPIMAPTVCVDDDCTETKSVSSSWQKVSDARNAWDAHAFVEGSGDLDRCNGKELPDGGYAYFATETFPYFLACYHGSGRTQ